jgi:hypothetical protein
VMMIGWTLASIYARTFWTSVISSGVRMSTS